MAQQKQDTNQGRSTEQAAGQRSELERAPGRERELARPLPGFQSPLAFTRRFLEDVDQLFDQFFGGGLPSAWQPGQTLGRHAFWSPEIEMFQRESDLVVRVDLPGVKKDEVRVELQDDTLVLEGRREQHREERRGGVYHNERSYGSFHRAIPLPEGVIGESAQATFKDGVLEIVMQAPPKQEKRGRQLEIKSGETGK